MPLMQSPPCPQHLLPSYYLCLAPSCNSRSPYHLCSECLLTHPVSHKLIPLSEVFSSQLLDDLQNLILSETMRLSHLSQLHTDHISTINTLYDRLAKHFLACLDHSKQRLINQLLPNHRIFELLSLRSDFQSLYNTDPSNYIIDNFLHLYRNYHQKFSEFVYNNSQASDSFTFQQPLTKKDLSWINYHESTLLNQALEKVIKDTLICNSKTIPMTSLDCFSIKQILKVSTSHQESICDMVLFENDLKMATCSADNSIIIWDLAKFKPIRFLSGHIEPINTVMMLKDNRLLSTSDDSTVRIWNCKTGKCEIVLAGHEDCVWNACQFVNSELIVTSSADESIKFWDLNKLSVTEMCIKTLKNSDQTCCFTMIPLNESQLACGSDKDINVYEVLGGDDPVRILKGHSDQIEDLVMYADGRTLISGSADSSIRFWNCQSGTCLRALEDPNKGGMTKIMVFSPGVLLAVSLTGNLMFWELRGEECARVVDTQQGIVGGIKMMENGRFLTCGENGTVKVWGMHGGDLTVY